MSCASSVSAGTTSPIPNSIEPTKGCEYFSPTGGGPYSFIEFSSTPCVPPKTGTPGNPVISAVLTIGGGSVSFGNQPYSVISGSEAYREADYVAQFSLAESYRVANNTGSGGAEANIYFVNPPYAASYNWESPLVYAPGNPDIATGVSVSTVTSCGTQTPARK